MQLIVELKSIKDITYLKKLQYVKYLLVGIKKLSLSSATEFDLEELKIINELIKNTNLKLIINLEKLYSEDELINLKKHLIELEKLNVAFYTYSDFGVYQLLIDYNLKFKTIFRAHTYLVNNQDLKLYCKLNRYVVLGTEISNNELIEVVDNNENLIVDLFVKTECFYSRRKLLSRYFEYRNSNNNPYKNNYLIKEELREEYQSIIEDPSGTHIYDEAHHYLLEELNGLKMVELGIIHTKFLNCKERRKITEAYEKYFELNDIDLFYQMIDETKIKYSKGVYNIQIGLLKKEASNE